MALGHSVPCHLRTTRSYPPSIECLAVRFCADHITIMDRNEMRAQGTERRIINDGLMGLMTQRVTRIRIEAEVKASCSQFG